MKTKSKVLTVFLFLIFTSILMFFALNQSLFMSTVTVINEQNTDNGVPYETLTTEQKQDFRKALSKFKGGPQQEVKTKVEVWGMESLTDYTSISLDGTTYKLEHKQKFSQYVVGGVIGLAIADIIAFIILAVIFSNKVQVLSLKLKSKNPEKSQAIANKITSLQTAPYRNYIAVSLLLIVLVFGLSFGLSIKVYDVEKSTSVGGNAEVIEAESLSDEERYELNNLIVEGFHMDSALEQYHGKYIKSDGEYYKVTKEPPISKISEHPTKSLAFIVLVSIFCFGISYLLHKLFQVILYLIKPLFELENPEKLNE